MRGGDDNRIDTLVVKKRSKVADSLRLLMRNLVHNLQPIFTALRMDIAHISYFHVPSLGKQL